jgi:hypothetical protein
MFLSLSLCHYNTHLSELYLNYIYLVITNKCSPGPNRKDAKRNKIAAEKRQRQPTLIVSIDSSEPNPDVLILEQFLIFFLLLDILKQRFLSNFLNSI